MKQIRIAVITITSLLSACSLLYGAARLVLAVEARRAQVFLQRLNTVALGEDEASVLPLFEKYEDLRLERDMGAGRGTLLRLDPWHFYRPFVGPRWIDSPVREALFRSGNWRRRVGLRLWVINAGMTFTEHKVKSVWTDLVVEGENEWLMADWSYAANIPMPSYEAKFYQEHGIHSSQSGYSVHWTHLHMGEETGEGVVNRLTPLATAAEFQTGRDIKLQCLTSVQGCHSLCELKPSVSRYMHEHNYSLGWNSGSWGRQDHSCGI